MQVLALQDLRAIFPALLAAFVQGSGGSVARPPAPAQAADLPGLGPLAELLVYAGGSHPWSAGDCVLTIGSDPAGLRPGDRVSYFPALQRPTLPVQVYGLGCAAAARARLAGVGLLAAALVEPAAQRSLGVTADLNPTAQALAGFAGWVPPGLPAAPLTRVPTGWNVSWDSGIFDDPLWDAALSTIWTAVAASADPQPIAAALAASIASGVRASEARMCAYHRAASCRSPAGPG